MLNKFKKHIEEKAYFTTRHRLLLACSGGPDSVVLCHLLKKAGYNFSLAHCNFQLRGKDAAADEKFVLALGKKLGAEVFVKRFDTKKFSKENKLSVQMAARKLRYDWFEVLMKEKKIDKLLTAHHLNDNLETFLLNFTRGAGWKGMKGIPEVNGKIVRPLLIFEKAEIEKFAKQNKIRFREDSSNYEEKYARNLLRKKVIPVFKKLNPSLEQTFLKNLNSLQPAFALLGELAAAHTQKFLVQVGNHYELDFLKMSEEKNFDFFLFEMLTPFGFNPEQIEMISGLVNSLPGKIIESENYILVRDRLKFLIRHKTEDHTFNEIELHGFPCSVYGRMNISFTVEEAKYFKIPQSRSIACFDLEKFGKKNVIRKWKTGDRFQPHGMEGTKKLSDFFTGQKMNYFEKQDCRVLESDGRIAWVIGRRTDERFAVKKETKQILVAEIQ
jgi:tRNA(Ile)-lysidine synthase